MAGVAVNLLWLLIGAIILAGVIYLVLYGIKTFITPDPREARTGHLVHLSASDHHLRHHRFHGRLVPRSGAVAMTVYKSIVISSGHGKYVRGASGIIDEVNEARRVVERVADGLAVRGVDVKVFHDETSHSQNENLDTIVNYHNAQARDLDVSVHFNAYVETAKPMGVEVLYVTQNALAGQVSAAIAACGFIDRGGKKRTDLFFLNNTEMPAILIEVCFVDSEADCDVYVR